MFFANRAAFCSINEILGAFIPMRLLFLSCAHDERVGDHPGIFDDCRAGDLKDRHRVIGLAQMRDAR
jgi:hypothetical protein